MMALVLLLAAVIAAVSGIAPPPPSPYDNYLTSQPNHGKKASFKHKYVEHNGAILDSQPSAPSIHVEATHTVSDSTHYKACKTIAIMVKNMPSEVFSAVTRSHGVGIFSKGEGPTVYPENYRLRDTAACHGKCSGSCSHTCTFDGRKWYTIAGITNSRSVVLDDNVACDRHDPYHHSESVLSHEFGHLVMRYIASSQRARIDAAYKEAHARQLWKLGTYAMANAHEFWAEATQAWFLTTIRTDVTGGLNMCGTTRHCPTEAAAREYIRHHQPALYNVLSYVYDNNNPALPGHLKICE